MLLGLSLKCGLGLGLVTPSRRGAREGAEDQTLGPQLMASCSQGLAALQCGMKASGWCGVTVHHWAVPERGVASARQGPLPHPYGEEGGVMLCEPQHQSVSLHHSVTTRPQSIAYLGLSSAK